MDSIHIKIQGPQVAAAYSRKMAGWLDEFFYPLDSGRVDRAFLRVRTKLTSP